MKENCKKLIYLVIDLRGKEEIKDLNCEKESADGFNFKFQENFDILVLENTFFLFRILHKFQVN